MDDATIKRLQEYLGFPDIWEEPSREPRSEPDEPGELYDGQRPPSSPQSMPTTIHCMASHVALGVPGRGLPNGSVDMVGDVVYNYDFGGHASNRPKMQSKPSSQRAPLLPASLADLQKVRFKEYRLEKGESAPEKMRFCPWKMVTSYPTDFIGNTNRPLAAPFFKQDELLSNQIWDFFYIWNTDAPSRDALLLVPTCQFQHLLDIVNATLGTALTIPHGKNGEKFNTTFGELATPKPRFLCRANKEETYGDLKAAVPGPDERDSLRKLNAPAREVYLEKLEAIYQATGGKKKRSAKKRQSRAVAHITWGRTSKRVQCYLGLRMRALNTDTAQGMQGRARLRLELPAPYQPFRSPVFVAMDTEWHEFNANAVTEVGVAILDTRDTVGIPPGGNFENWFRLIRAHHIRVKEHAHIVNHRYVKGCPDRFNFGESTFVALRDIPRIISALLNPRSVRGKSIDTQNNFAAGEQHSVVLVGHGFEQDIPVLKKVGYNVYDNRHLIEIVDTRDVDQHYRRSNNPASLENVLLDLGIPHYNLHNGGNDAVYTLQALIGLAIKARKQSLARGRDSKRTEVALFDVVNSDPDGWSSGGEMSDGGLPEAVIDPALVWDKGSSEEFQQSATWGQSKW